jgi:hypothetical protein
MGSSSPSIGSSPEDDESQLAFAFFLQNPTQQASVNKFYSRESFRLISIEPKRAISPIGGAPLIMKYVFFVANDTSINQ